MLDLLFQPTLWWELSLTSTRRTEKRTMPRRESGPKRSFLPSPPCTVRVHDADLIAFSAFFVRTVTDRPNLDLLFRQLSPPCPSRPVRRPRRPRPPHRPQLPPRPHPDRPQPRRRRRRRADWPRLRLVRNARGNRRLVERRASVLDRPRRPSRSRTTTTLLPLCGRAQARARERGRRARRST